MLCRWGMGLVGEMVTEVIRRESHLPSRTRSSGCSPVAFTSITSESNLGVLEEIDRCPDSSVIQARFPILTLAEVGTAFPNVLSCFPFRSLHPALEVGERVSIHLSRTALVYLCLASGDLTC